MHAQAEQAKAIFLAAIEKASPEERAAYLQDACGSDVELRRRVETLLRAHQPEDSFLDSNKLHPGQQDSGHTQTSDFSDTASSDQGTSAAKRPSHMADHCFTPSQQPGSMGRFIHYEVLQELGQGGFGVVYRVFDEKLHRVVALKLLSPLLASQGAARQRFLREARAAAAVRHEHVISIHAVDDAPLPHLVMEYISGQTLQQKIDAAGTLSVKEILRIGYQIALGLDAAHRQGLIHRDIKPSNILLENGIERVKISDFGLARAVDDTSISHQGLIVGTPSFMSPEQAEGKPVDARSDLFSLGSCLYAMCTGSSPFQGSSTLSVLKRVVEETPTPVQQLNAEIPDWLQTIVMKLLAKNPDHRYQQAGEVASELGKYLAELQSKGVVQTEPRRRTLRQRILGVFAVVIPLLILLGILEARGVTRFSAPLTKLFYHQLTLQLPDRDTIVELWETTDTDEAGKTTKLISPMPFAPAAIVVNESTQQLSLPPGRYWLFARRHGVQLDRRLLHISWGGTSHLKIPIPTKSALNQNDAAKQRLLKAFDPAKEMPVPAPWVDPKSTVFTEAGGWKVVNNSDEGMFYFNFQPLLDNLPSDGIIICKAKIKLKKLSTNGWGELLLNSREPELDGFDWPKHLFQYESNIDDWTTKEVRYPAQAFQKLNPLQISVSFMFHIKGTIWVKDLELYHLPGSVPVSASKLPELEKLVKLAEAQQKTVDTQYQAGLVPYDQLLTAKVHTIRQSIALEEARQRLDLVFNQYKQLKFTQNQQLSFAKQLAHLGRLKESDLLAIEADLVKTDMKLQELNEKLKD